MTPSESTEKAKFIAKQIVKGEIKAFDGAMQIWKKIIDKLDTRIPDALWPFKSNASAIEDYLFNAQDAGANHDVQIERCKDEIKCAAKSLLGNHFKG